MKVAHSCPTLCDLIDCIVHGILQARILEKVAFPLSRACFWKYSCHQGYKRCSQKCTSTQYECIGLMPNLGWTKWWKPTCWTTDWSIKSASCVMTHSSMNDQQEQPSPSRCKKVSCLKVRAINFIKHQLWQGSWLRWGIRSTICLLATCFPSMKLLF